MLYFGSIGNVGLRKLTVELDISNAINVRTKAAWYPQRFQTCSIQICIFQNCAMDA